MKNQELMYMCPDHPTNPPPNPPIKPEDQGKENQEDENNG